MTRKPVRGLFVTGTSTEVGKTFVAARIARSLTAAGYRVGVYKPAASGCRSDDTGDLVSDDAVALWEGAGKPKTLTHVCPQRFAAPLAPHLAAEAEGRRLDATLLRTGLETWLEESDIVLIEGAGGLMSPIAEDEFVADLAYDFGFPLLVVTPNELGVINQVLQTLIVAATFRDGLSVAGIVLNRPRNAGDASLATNRREIERHAVAPILTELAFGADGFSTTVSWYDVAAESIQRESE